MGTAGYLTTVKLGGTPTAITDEPTTKVTANTVYQITDAAKRILDRTTAVTVKVDPDGAGAAPAAVADPSTYSIDYPFGKITFKTDQGASAVVTVSGKYIPITAVAGANRYALNQSSTVLDDTDYPTAQANGGYRSRLLGLHDVNLTLGRFADTSKAFSDALKNRTPLLMEVRPGGAGDYFRGWMVVESDNASGDIDALEAEEISFQLDGDAKAAFNWGQ